MHGRRVHQLLNLYHRRAARLHNRGLLPPRLGPRLPGDPAPALLVQPPDIMGYSHPMTMVRLSLSDSLTNK